MSKKLLVIGCAVAAVAAPATAADLSVYGRLPSIENVRISPDGQRLAIVVTDGEKRFIEVKEIGSNKLLAGIRAGDQKVRDLAFVGDEHVIVTSSVAGYIADVYSAKLESWMALDFNIVTQKQRGLLEGAVASSAMTSTDGGTLNTIEGLPELRMVNGKPVAFVKGTVFVATVGEPAIFRIDLSNGTAVVKTQLNEHSQGWAMGADDILGELHDDGSDKWSLQRWTGSYFAPTFHGGADGATSELLGAGRDGVSFLVRQWKDHIPEIREVSADGKTVGDPLPLPDADVAWTETGGPKLIGLSGLEGDQDRYIFFAPHDQAVWNAIVNAYPGERASLIDYDSARDRWVVKVDSPTEGPDYAMVDLKTGQSTWIGPEYQDLKPADISAVRAIRFTAADGVALTGYLTTPLGKPEKALPLVVLVHGGPADRDEPGFDWWSQALASRGYAVLRVNFRGSDGFGWDFQSKGFGEWGRKMQTDLSDGVAYLAGQGAIDPKRVCIVGASYGGYAALAGAAFGHGVYRCAASVAGPADLARMISWDQSKETNIAGKETKRYWLRYMGPADKLDEISPAKHAADITAPVLLVHGKDDTVVAFEQSQMMADALKRAGKPFDFVVLKNEDHWLSRGATRLEMLTAVCEFLAKNNPAT